MKLKHGTRIFDKFCRKCNAVVPHYIGIGRCVNCSQSWTKKHYWKRKEYYINKHNLWKKKNRIVVNKINRDWRFQNKLKVIKHYTKGTMQCQGINGKCPFKNYKFEPETLQIDHVNGNGIKDRERIRKMGVDLTRYLIRENFPKEYQILCPYCNAKKELIKRGTLKK